MSITIKANPADTVLLHPDERYRVHEITFRRGAYRPKNDVIKFGERQIEVDHREFYAILVTLVDATTSARGNGALHLSTRLAYDDFNSYPTDALVVRFDYSDMEVVYMSIDDMSMSVAAADLVSVLTFLRQADLNPAVMAETSAPPYAVEQHGYNVKIVCNDGNDVSLDTNGDGASTLAFAQQVVTAANGFTAAIDALERIANLGSMTDNLNGARAIANATLAELTRGD